VKDAAMAGTAPERDSVDLRAAGERIEALLRASAAQGAMARERSEELVRLVTDLYGAGLERLLNILHLAGRLDAGVLATIAADDLVASLLLVHGLHPYDLGTRVEQALATVRAQLRPQGVDVEIAAVDPDGTVRLRLVGSLGGCSVTAVRETVEAAVEAAAPDATAVHVEIAARPSLIPVSALRSRLTEVPR
jgi:Fe-S cluster biogenesis protein NfuA